MPASGRDSGLGFGFESTYGTTVAAATWARLEELSITPTDPQIAIQELHNGRAGFGRSAVSVVEDIPFSLRARGHYSGGMITSFIRWALGGTWSTSGAGPYKHDLAPGSTIPSATLRTINGTGVGGASATGAVIGGAKCSNLELKISAEGLMEVTASGVASSWATGSAPTPTYGTDDAILPQSVGTLSWNSGTYSLNSFGIVVANALSEVRQLGSKNISAAYQTGLRSLRMEVEILRESDAWQSAHTALTESDAIVIITNGTDIFKATVYTARVEDAVAINMASTDLVTETIGLRGRDDGTNDTVLFEITNGDSGAEDS